MVFPRIRLLTGLAALLMVIAAGAGSLPARAQEATPVVVNTPTHAAEPTAEATAIPSETPPATDPLAGAEGTPASIPSDEAGEEPALSIQALAATLVSPVDPVIVQASCTNGVFSSPTVTPVEAPGLTYQVVDAPTAGGSTVVTATLTSSDYAFGPIPDNWTVVQGVVAVATFNFDPNPPCVGVVPVSPTVTQASCAGGTFAPPSVALPANSPVLTYTQVGTVAVGRSVIVTAELERDSDTWQSPLPAGWTLQGSFAVVSIGPFAKAACSPAAPVVTDSTCRNGEGTPTTISLPPSSSSIRYTLQQGPGIAIVIASLELGTLVWANPLPAGWTELNDTVALFRIDGFDNSPCTDVRLADSGIFPDLIADAFEPGEAIDLAPIVPASRGITYTISGIAAPNETVTVTAELHDGYSWPDTLPAGWTRIDGDTAVFTFVIDGDFDYAGDAASDDAPAPAFAEPAPSQVVTALPSTGNGAGHGEIHTWLILATIPGALAAAAGWRHTRRT